MASNRIKRLIICCDGTWMDSDDGFKKPTLIPYQPTGVLQVPSNVTRIHRALRRTGRDGVNQILFYHSGVGTGSSKVDMIAGGLLGVGISENIREVYSFIAANYTPGDEIVLIGFSRGAFTVRSVASMINNIGLLTRTGMNDFYPIFKDQQNFKNRRYRDMFPDIPFPNKPSGPNFLRDYKQRLERDGFTRVRDPNGNRIMTHAVAVWDTVGSLGIPNISLLAKLGLPHSTIEYKFFDTNLTGNIRHAFQALSLDERRSPFKAAVWERANSHQTTVDLRQVWFPGAHSNVGGGYDDQEIANISLAWMMDQLASIGIAFQDEYIVKVFLQNVRYYENPPKQQAKLSSITSRTPQWAVDPIYEKHRPVRPWGLGKIWDSKSSFWHLSGTAWRSPGLNMRADPDTGLLTDIPMRDTNERIHSCVRVRLELDGLGLDDKGLYDPQALTKNWRLRKLSLRVQDPIPHNAAWGPGAPGSEGTVPKEVRWVWEYIGPPEDAPVERYMVEETLGPYERKLLLLNKGRKFYKRFRRRKRRSRPDDDYDHGQYDIEGDLTEDKSVTPIPVRSSQTRSSRSGTDERRRRRKSQPVIVALESEDSLVDDRNRLRSKNASALPIRGASRAGSLRGEKTRPVSMPMPMPVPTAQESTTSESESEDSLVDEKDVRKRLREKERYGDRDRDRDGQLFDEKRRGSRAPSRAPNRPPSRAPSRLPTRQRDRDDDDDEIVVTEEIGDRRRPPKISGRSREGDRGNRDSHVDGRKY